MTEAGGDLAQRSCVPCRGGVPPMPPAEVESYLARLAGWTHTGHKRIAKRYTFGRYAETVAFFNRVADTAEREGHHPVCTVGFRELTVEIWTHKIDGLTESDFVLAAKIDSLAR